MFLFIQEAKYLNDYKVELKFTNNNNIENKIYTIRDTKVMLDSDLAKLYEITTGNLNKAVSRNIERFPLDFMFRLSSEEYSLLFQNGISKRGGRKTLPRVFTEQGISMLSSVLKSKIAIEINIQIMRTFTKMREFTLYHKDILIKLQDMERSMQSNQNQTNENSKHIKTAFDLLSQILEDTANADKNLIGFARE